MMGGFDGMMGNGLDGFGLAAGLTSTLLLAALLAFAVIFLSKALPAQTARGARSGIRPEEILRERFARGEISAEEYGRSLRTLNEEPAWGDYDDYVRQKAGERPRA